MRLTLLQHMQAQHKILLVEDDSALGFLYNLLLTESGYEVFWRDNCSDALTDLGTNEFNLILLDIMLPDMSGLQMLNAMQPPHIKKTVMLTNLDHQAVLEEASMKGTKGWIIKSQHTPESFIQHVQSFLSDRV